MGPLTGVAVRGSEVAGAVAHAFGGSFWWALAIGAMALVPAALLPRRAWEKVARAKVAHLRSAAGADLDDPYLVELVDELSLESEEFRRLWARHDVVGKTHEAKRIHHHEVGDLTLTCELFNISSAPGQQLTIFQAEPASPSEHALALLGSLAVMTA